MAEQRRPRQTVFPVLRYREADRAIRFLTEAFGFTAEVRYPPEGDPVEHAELRFGESAVMVGSARGEDAGPVSVPPAPQVLFAVVDDPDAHCARARAAGAEILAEPADTDYGSREYAARDPEGNVWGFGTYWRDSAERQD
ncbi:VOC family protein [Nocardiopsis composta]|uniref:Putative glyoxalase superfamily protein PhnB n=1 Tax=Nocardiopsis composta TaxID=157465 RepID=A0A7W8VGU7_9ACTN|nr:VOC family protein [Nocardiopsis composta]MBB5435927.1 putative glyoxalase superfamily protein PhnB [Nocardiopsis composta]